MKVYSIFSKSAKCTLVPACIISDKIFKHRPAVIKTGQIYKRMYVLVVKYTTHFLFFSFFFFTKIITQLSMSVLDNGYKSRLMWPITFYSLKLDQVQEGG